jgi:PTH1 family peptidyl-tRNA hydrolase
VAYLIVGLGNPGPSYSATRHNVGFEIAKAFAFKRNWKFRGEASLKAELAQGMIEDKRVLVLLPMTFMNESGQAVRSALDYFKVPLENLILVSDDVSLSTGVLRMRFKGSSGGHNGLKSVEHHLGTAHYARLRVGIGEPKERQPLEDYVLGRFSQEESKVVLESVPKAVDALELWITKGVAAAMQAVNTKIQSEGESK